MTEKTLTQLRDEARARGLKGYSTLTKTKLMALLGAPVVAKATKKPAAKKKIKTTTKTMATPRKKKAARVAAHPEPVATLLARRAATAGAEESIEAAKYTSTTTGFTPGERRLADLQEDIDALPPLRQPRLVLLAQKPGVLHTYWALPAGSDVTRARLRLCRIEGREIEVIEEVALPALQGHWYFPLPEGFDANTWCVHLGRYDTHGQFVSSFERAIARLPTLFADGRPDKQWWIDEVTFRAMYLRAGGVARGKRLGWPGSFSSR